MKYLTTPIKLSVSLAAFLLSQASFAGGTDAGTIVENTATISYSVGGAAQAPITSDVADFKVDQKVDLTVTGDSGTNIIVSPSTARATTGNKLTYVLKNEGNSPQDFSVLVKHLATDNFDAGTGTTTSPQAFEACQFTVTPDGPGTAIAATAISATPPVVSLIKDESATIEVTCSMPNRPDVDDGHLSTLEVLAAAVDAAGVIMAESTIADREDDIDVVLADGIGASDANRDAIHSDTQTYEIDVPMLTVVKKSAVISDPFNGTAQPKRIPGAVVEYTITVENTSDSVASGLTVTDVLTAAIAGEVAYVTGSVISTSGATPTFDAASNTVEATGISVPAGTTATPSVAVVTFRVTIL